MFLGPISSGNETKVLIIMLQTWENENQQDWLSFFIIPLPCHQTTAKKEEKPEYENHTQFKYDSQIIINHWSIDVKAIRHVRKSS